MCRGGSTERACMGGSGWRQHPKHGSRDRRAHDFCTWLRVCSASRTRRSAVRTCVARNGGEIGAGSLRPEHEGNRAPSTLAVGRPDLPENGRPEVQRRLLIPCERELDREEDMPKAVEIMRALSESNPKLEQHLILHILFSMNIPREEP